MKNISTELKEHLAGEVACMANCWKITRKDGAVLGFTSHDADIEIDGVTYRADTGITPTAVQTNSSFAVDNLEVEGMLSADSIREADLNAGLYDFAELEVFMVNYEDLSMGQLPLRRGWIGEVTYGAEQFVAEVRGLTQKLSQRIGDVFTPQCRAVFADTKCGIDAANFMSAATVDSAESREVFASSALTQTSGYFNFGKVRFTSGENSGLSMEVKEFAAGRVILVLPLPYEIASGDGFEIVAGCDKNFNTCVGKFSNAVNFRGEPHVPGSDKALETAGTFSSES